MQRRGSYFYVIDAFIASIIIIGAIVLIFSRHAAQQQGKQPLYTAEDFLSAAETTQVRGLDSPLMRTWIANGTVDNPKRTLIQQLALFETKGEANNTAQLAEILASGTPQNMGIEILVNGNQRFIRQVSNQSTADTLLSSKRVILLRQSSTSLYDPAIVEVRTWQ